jgi:hypothetical protein
VTLVTDFSNRLRSAKFKSGVREGRYNYIRTMGLRVEVGGLALGGTRTMGEENRRTEELLERVARDLVDPKRFEKDMKGLPEGLQAGVWRVLARPGREWGKRYNSPTEVRIKEEIPAPPYPGDYWVVFTTPPLEASAEERGEFHRTFGRKQGRIWVPESYLSEEKLPEGWSGGRIEDLICNEQRKTNPYLYLAGQFPVITGFGAGEEQQLAEIIIASAEEKNLEIDPWLVESILGRGGIVAIKAGQWYRRTS